MSETFPVVGTMARPAGVPLFVLSRNNLNPRVTATEEGLAVKIVRTTVLPWDQIRKVLRKEGWGTTRLLLTCGGWEYILHFRDLDALVRLETLLTERR